MTIDGEKLYIGNRNIGGQESQDPKDDENDE